MSAGESIFSFTTKINGDLFTIRGNTGEEFANNLVWTTNNYDQILEHVTALQAAGNAASLVNTASAPLPQAAPPQPNAVPTSSSYGDGPACKHGEPAKYIAAGVSKKTGQPYRAFYACGRPQGQQCDFRASA